MFFHDKVHRGDVVKWGVFAGVLESIYIFIAAILYEQRSSFNIAYSSGEHWASIVLLAFVAVSAVITTVIVFAHPLHCFIRRHYLDAVLTILLTMCTMLLTLLFTLYSFGILYA